MSDLADRLEERAEKSYSQTCGASQLDYEAAARLRKLEAVIDKALDEDYISNQWLQEALAACGDES